MSDTLDIALLKKRLKYTFGKLRHTIDVEKQNPHDADEAKSAIRLALEQLTIPRCGAEIRKAEADPLADVKAAHAAGKVVQFQLADGEWGELCEAPRWDAAPHRYRVKMDEEPIADPLADVKAAHKAGKVVQFQLIDGEWTELCESPGWAAEPHRYRVKPEPRVVPWTRETCPPLPFEVIDKATHDRGTICNASEKWAYNAGMGDITWQNLLINYTLRDGSPCGTKEEA